MNDDAPSRNQFEPPQARVDDLDQLRSRHRFALVVAGLALVQTLRVGRYIPAFIELVSNGSISPLAMLPLLVSFVALPIGAALQARRRGGGTKTLIVASLAWACGIALMAFGIRIWGDLVVPSLGVAVLGAVTACRGSRRG